MNQAKTTRSDQVSDTACATPEDQLAKARQLLENNRAAEALPHLERVSATLESAAVAALAGCVAVSIGDLARAETQFELQAQRAPDTADAHVNLGLLNAARERWEAAVFHFRAAVSRNPACADWQNDLGVALVKTGDPEAAESALRTARELAPDHADAAVNLADLCESSDRNEEAFRVLADYQSHCPDDASVTRRKMRLFETLPEAFRASWQEPVRETSPDLLERKDTPGDRQGT
jgi:Flp pilus assembly protein TadD